MRVVLYHANEMGDAPGGGLGGEEEKFFFCAKNELTDKQERFLHSTLWI